eukprot:EG_transcript_6377
MAWLTQTLELRHLFLALFSFAICVIPQKFYASINLQEFHPNLDASVKTSKVEQNGRIQRLLPYSMAPDPIRQLHFERVKNLDFPHRANPTRICTKPTALSIGLMAAVVAPMALFFLWFLRHNNTRFSFMSMTALDGSLDTEDKIEPTETQRKKFQSQLADRERSVAKDSAALESAMSFFRGEPPIDLPAEDGQEGPPKRDMAQSNLRATKIQALSPTQQRRQHAAPEPEPKPEPEPPRFSEEYFRRIEEGGDPFQKLAGSSAATFKKSDAPPERDPEAAWIDENDDDDDDDDDDPDDFDDACSQMSSLDLERALKLLQRQVAEWKDDFFLQHSREPTRDDIAGSEVESVLQQHKVAMQWLMLKRRQKDRRSSPEPEEAPEPKAPYTRFSSIRGRDEAALRKLCIQTEKQCAELSVSMLLRFKGELEKEILDYKRSVVGEEFSGRNVHDLPMLRLYLQYGIVKNWLAAKAEEKNEDPLYHERTERLNKVAEKLDVQCRRMTTHELKFRKKTLREDIFEWKRKFIDVHQRSPTEDDVFQLGMDSAFTEYGIVSALLEGRPKEEEEDQTSGA